jgi:uncharacterized membrane protein
MTRTSADLIEGYIARLKAELDFLGAAEAHELVSEVRSLLVDAAGDDAERAAAEIAKFGEPAELAAGILAERGLSADGGMTPADWWRMGIAAPIDIAIGLSVPLAALVPTYGVWRAAGTVAWPFTIAVTLFFAGTLLWPFYAWRPWWVGGRRLSAGMSLTGITVVRAPGFRRVVRTSDLAGMGLPKPTRGWVSGAAALLLAAALITFSGSWVGSMVSNISPDAWFQELAGPDAEQAMAARGAADYLYDCVVKGWPEQARDSMTVGGLMNFDEFVTRAKADGLVSYAVGEPVRLGPGVWDVPVVEKTRSGDRTVTVTVNLRVLVAVQGWQSDWVITEIRGEGLTPRPSP